MFTGSLLGTEPAMPIPEPHRYQEGEQDLKPLEHLFLLVGDHLAFCSGTRQRGSSQPLPHLLQLLHRLHRLDVDPVGSRLQV